MKNILLLSLFLIGLVSIEAKAQVGKTYYSMEEAMKNPTQVYFLDLSMQKIAEISPDIGEFVNLEKLDLSFNIFSDLPDEMAELKKLKVLKLTGCRRMPKLPEVVKEIPALKELELLDMPEWSSTQIANVKKALPDVKVVSE